MYKWDISVIIDMFMVYILMLQNMQGEKNVV